MGRPCVASWRTGLIFRWVKYSRLILHNASSNPRMYRLVSVWPAFHQSLILITVISWFLLRCLTNSWSLLCAVFSKSTIEVIRILTMFFYLANSMCSIMTQDITSSPPSRGSFPHLLPRDTGEFKPPYQIPEIACTGAQSLPGNLTPFLCYLVMPDSHIIAKNMPPVNICASNLSIILTRLRENARLARFRWRHRSSSGAPALL